MSDAMMFGIAKMPYEMAMRDELSRRQFYANTQRLVAALEAAREDAERYRLLRRKVCIAGGEFHILNLGPRYIAPDAAAELDAVIDEARGKGVAGGA